MPEAIGSFTRRYEARSALRFAPAPQPPLTDAERQAMLERMLARAAALNGWPEGKPPSWSESRCAARPVVSPQPKAA